MFKMWRGSQPSSGQNPDPQRPLCLLSWRLQPTLFMPRASLAWVLPSVSSLVSDFRASGSAPHLGVPAAILPPQQCCKECPDVSHFPRKLGVTGFILLCLGFGTGRCSVVCIQLMGGGLGQLCLDRQVCQPHHDADLPLAGAGLGTAMD